MRRSSGGSRPPRGLLPQKACGLRHGNATRRDARSAAARSAAARPTKGRPKGLDRRCAPLLLAGRHEVRGQVHRLVARRLRAWGRVWAARRLRAAKAAKGLLRIEELVRWREALNATGSPAGRRAGRRLGSASPRLVSGRRLVSGLVSGRRMLIEAVSLQHISSCGCARVHARTELQRWRGRRRVVRRRRAA